MLDVPVNNEPSLPEPRIFFFAIVVDDKDDCGCGQFLFLLFLIFFSHIILPSWIHNIENFHLFFLFSSFKFAALNLLFFALLLKCA